jgi:hypothetical protein
LSGPLPMPVLPSRKVTVSPVVLKPVQVTVAVNVTACPAIDGLSDDTRLVLLVSWTTCVTVLEFDGRQVPWPGYEAVTPWLPTESVLVVKLALPLWTVPVPSGPLWSANVTVSPLKLQLMLAVNVTACPDVDGLSEETSVVVVLWVNDIWTKAGLFCGLKDITLVAPGAVKLEPPPPPAPSMIPAPPPPPPK